MATPDLPMSPFRRAFRWVTRLVRPAVPDPSTRPRIEPTDGAVRAALSQVEDPEVGIDIVNIGLLRGWDVAGDELRVRLTVTSAACPVGPHIADAAQRSLADAFPHHTCLVTIVADPPWRPEDMSDRARGWLGHASPDTVDPSGVDPAGLAEAFGALDVGGAVVLVDDHDPKPIYAQLQAAHGSMFGWEYLERGPETWRVRIERVA